MKKIIVVSILGLLFSSTAWAQSDWQTIKAEDAGFDPVKLESIQRDLAARNTSGLLIIRRGKIVWEWYSPDSGPEKVHYTASMAKALVGGMSLMLALNDGRIKPDDVASKYIPFWKDDPLRARITIRELATHTSGIEDAEQDDIPHMKLPGWKGAFWRQDMNPFVMALREAPVIFEPGTDNAYSNCGMAALAYAVTASLRGAPQPDIKSLLAERIMQPLGIPPSAWSIGYGHPFVTDGLNVYANWGGGAFTARATARVGQLMLNRGEWHHRQLVSREWAEKVVANAGMPAPHGPMEADSGGSGFGWWMNKGGWPGVPRDAFGGAGAGHQMLLVVPSLDLIIVRNGQTINPTDHEVPFSPPLVDYVMRPIIDAITDRGAYPPSPVIHGASFAAQATMTRKAIDSDNWPLTWADDNAQYTSYGDGEGFEPFVPKKLSMGFTRVEGSATNFRGINIRTETGERTGDGGKGLKASGILMVDHVLYLWVRNAQNAQLAWSTDHGRTWQWGFRFESGFGSPAFLNFGRNYSGARDEYVYTYSQNGDSAYNADDSLLLARVRKSQIRIREAWEFFEGLDERGVPVWTQDLQCRGEVFRYPRHCERVDAVYDPALKRYLLAIGYNHASGWGIYDAPEPWGPWTTAFHTDKWDVPGTHGYRLPAKWIDRDGRHMTLVFSGLAPYDAFCVRSMTLDAR